MEKLVTLLKKSNPASIKVARSVAETFNLFMY